MELQTYFETTLKITLLYFDLTMLNSLHNKYKSEYYIKAKLQILDSLLGIKVSTTFRGIFTIFEVIAPVPYSASKGGDIVFKCPSLIVS